MLQKVPKKKKKNPTLTNFGPHLSVQPKRQQNHHQTARQHSNTGQQTQLPHRLTAVEQQA